MTLNFKIKIIIVSFIQYFGDLYDTKFGELYQQVIYEWLY